MKKTKYILVALLLAMLTIPVRGQDYTIQWDKKPISSKTKQRLSFDNAVFNQENYATYQFSIAGVSWSDIVVVPLETVTLEEPNKYFIPSKLSPVVSQVSFYRGKPVTQVAFMPIIINSLGAVEKIVRFKLEYKEIVISQPDRVLKTSTFSRPNARTSAVTGSILSSGQWFKFPVSKDGIYKIDYTYLQSLGINPANINPQQIRLFGNGGGMLPQPNADARYDDLIENAIVVFGEQDGRFDPGDYVLFYAKSAHTWNYNSSTGLYEHVQNLYSDEAYYFFNFGLTNGLRVSAKNSLGAAAQSFNYFDDRDFHELDATNIIYTGREWYGEKFGAINTLSIPFAWAGARAGSQLKTGFSVLGRSFVSTSFSVRLNEKSMSPDIFVPAMSSGALHVEGVNVSQSFSTNVSTLASFNMLNVNLTFNNGGVFSSEAHLDAITIQGEKTLKIYGNQTVFRCIASKTQLTSEYRIQNADASIVVWDVTDPLLPVQVNCSLQGSELVFADQSTVIREYVCFTGAAFPYPGAGSKIGNQNLHAITAPDLPDMVIVSHPLLKGEAERLARHRKSVDNLDVTVVTTEQVFNEFSSGAQDITAIRDFMKMLYDRSTATDSVRYLLLFGDCSYDYKNRVPNNTNFVPCYQSRNSLDPVRSYSSEDYYGFMDNLEGNWGEVLGSEEQHTIDIFVGRIPANAIEQAAIMVNKIIHYQTALPTQAKWKNKALFVADDGDANTHMLDAEIMATTVAQQDSRYNINKLYLDAYPQETSTGGEKSPIMVNLINEEIQKGTFILNYNGHGGTGGWAQEQILTLPQIDAWTNFNAMPLVVTATCDFGLYDNPSIRSGTDAVLFNTSGGGIGILTATRIVYQYSNQYLNSNLYKVLFKPYGTDILPRIGDVMKLTKNKSMVGVNNRNYTFLGDPSMKLAYPQNEIVVTKINNIPISAIADTIKALSKVSIEGEVRNQSGVFLSSYNGIANVTCFDKENNVSTLGSAGPVMSFKLSNNFFFEGKATITNGKFTVTFVAPKDILFLYGQGKISLYAIAQSGINDAGGNYDNVQVGGANASAAADNTPPGIRLYMNDETFVSGGLTSDNPLFIAKVSDDNGINVGTGSVGHEITTVLSDNSNVLVLNEYYTTELDNYTKGVVRYPMKNFNAGNHSLKFKVWDTYNNSSEAYLEFVVANSEKLALNHVLNYPNPFSTHTDFHFDHNRAGDDLEVLIQIYTVSGKMIKTINQAYYASPTHISGLIWDGRDDFGDKIGKGVYVYKVKVRSIRDGSTIHKYEKLVLLN